MEQVEAFGKSFSASSVTLWKYPKACEEDMFNANSEFWLGAILIFIFFWKFAKFGRFFWVANF